MQQQIANCTACGSAATNSKLYGMRQQLANAAVQQQIANCTARGSAATNSKLYGMRQQIAVQQQIANYMACGNK